MRNLKRALSLAMATFMLLGMMVVGAGATSYNDFSDGEKIVNTEAVNTMVALGVIAGRDTGEFDPAGVVTRGEMAKLIAVMLNGGKDPTLGAVTTAFTDAKGHWAEPFIAYCANLGILNGYGDNTVKPDGIVTGTEAAKMLLTALGYRSDIEKLTGLQWVINTNVLANKVELYNGLELNPAEGLTRDNTAQMIYNAVQANEVEYRNNYGEYSGVIYAQPAGTVLANRFKVVKVEGVAVANDVFGLNDYSAAPNGKVRLVNCNTYTVANAYGNIRDVAYDNVYPIAVPNEMVGRRVVIYVKFQNNLAPNAADSTVIGAPILSSKNTVVTTSNKLGNDDKVKDLLRDNDLTLGAEMLNDKDKNNLRGVLEASSVKFGFTEGNVKLSDGVTSAPGVKVDFIDHTGDGTVDYILRETAKLAKITVYNESGKKLTVAGVGEIDFKYIANPEDVALNDMVLWTKYDNTYYFAKPETVEGTFEAFNNDADKMVMDGTAYGKSAVPYTRDGTTLEDYVIGEDTVGMSYTLYFDQYSNVVAVDLYENVAPNYALVLEAATLGGINNRGEIKVLLADGTVGTYTVSMLSSAARFGFKGNDAAKEAAMSALLAKTGLEKDGPAALVNTIVSYAFGDDNKITIGNPAYNTSYSSLTDVSDDGTATGSREVNRTISQYTFDKTKTDVNGAGLSTTTNPANSTAIVVNDNTTFFFNDGAGSYAVVKGVNKLPSANIVGSHLVSAIYRNVNDDQTRTAVARAVFVEGTFVGALDYLYVSAQYTNIHGKVGERIYTFPVVFEDGKAGEIKIKEGTSGLPANDINDGQIYSYSTDNAGYSALAQDNINTMTATKGKTINGYVSTYSENGSMVMRWGKNDNDGVNDELAFTLAGDAKVWNVEGDAPVATNLTANQSVVFATDSNGFIKTAFIKDTNVVFRNFTNATKNAFNIQTVNGATGDDTATYTLNAGASIKAATGFGVKIMNLNNSGAKVVEYSKITDGGEKNDLFADGKDSGGNRSITMPSYATVTINNIVGGTTLGGGTPSTGDTRKVIFYDVDYSGATFYVAGEEVEPTFHAPGMSYISVKDDQTVVINHADFGTLTGTAGKIDETSTVACTINKKANTATFKLEVKKNITLVAPDAADKTPGDGDIKVIFDGGEYDFPAAIPADNTTFTVNGKKVTPIPYVAPTRGAANGELYYFMANEDDEIVITGKTAFTGATANTSYKIAENVIGTIGATTVLTFKVKTADITLPTPDDGTGELFASTNALLAVVLADGLTAINWSKDPIVEGNTYYVPGTTTTVDIISAAKTKFIVVKSSAADPDALHVAKAAVEADKNITIDESMRVYPAVKVDFTDTQYTTDPAYKNLKGVSVPLTKEDYVAVGTPITFAFKVDAAVGTGVIAVEDASGVVTGANLAGNYTTTTKDVALLPAYMLSIGEGVKAETSGGKAITNGTYVKVGEAVTLAAADTDNYGVIAKSQTLYATDTAVTTVANTNKADVAFVAAVKVTLADTVAATYEDAIGTVRPLDTDDDYFVMEGTKLTITAVAAGHDPITVAVGLKDAAVVTEGVLTEGEAGAEAAIEYTVGTEALVFDTEQNLVP